MIPVPAGAARNIRNATALEPFRPLMPRPAPPSPGATVRSSRRLPGPLDARRNELRFFIETARTLSSSRNPKLVLRAIINRARVLVRCRAWSLFVVDPTTRDLVFDMVGGSRARILKGLRIRAGHGIGGWVASHGKAVVVRDARTDRRFVQEVDEATELRTRSVLCLPILSKGKPVAVLEMLNKIGTPFTRHDLQLLSRLIGQASLALERASLIEQVASLVITDELTGLFNVRYLDEALEREIRRCHRYRSTLALIFLDLDHFKEINTRYGHLLGSRCLTELAEIMRQSVRDVDIPVRYGGDEFAVILPESSVGTARMVAERLGTAIRSHVFLQGVGLRAPLAASIGIAGFPDHAKTKQELILKADAAMYRSKGTGGDRISMADPL
jgi:diguanylate cyclase (GGDEF)-like protein